MRKLALLLLFAIILNGFEIEQQSVQEAPHTYYGNSIVACLVTSQPMKTNGFGTSYSANTYACPNWNNKANALPDCFVSINGACRQKASNYCDHCIVVINSDGQKRKCRIIDVCNANTCNFLDCGHLQFLDNDKNSHYKFVDKGKYIEPYPDSGQVPIFQWGYLESCSSILSIKIFEANLFELFTNVFYHALNRELFAELIRFEMEGKRSMKRNKYVILNPTCCIQF